MSSRSNKGGRGVVPQTVTTRPRSWHLPQSDIEIKDEPPLPIGRRPRDPRKIRNVQPRPPRRNPMIRVDKPTGERELRTPIYEPDEYLYENEEEDDDE